jgi:hypothetical protein
MMVVDMSRRCNAARIGQGEEDRGMTLPNSPMVLMSIMEDNTTTEDEEQEPSNEEAKDEEGGVSLIKQLMNSNSDGTPSEVFTDAVKKIDAAWLKLYFVAHESIIKNTIQSRKEVRGVHFTGKNANDTIAVEQAINKFGFALFPIHPRLQHWYDKLKKHSAGHRAAQNPKTTK